jgi:hypothetical protein
MAWSWIRGSLRQRVLPSGTRHWRWLKRPLDGIGSRWARIKNYDTRELVRELRALRVTPHVAQHTTGRASAIAGRTTCHPGYAVSQRKRTCVEEIFGWMKTVGLLRKTRHRGVARVGWMFTFVAAVYNLVRMRTLTAAA